MPVDSIALIPAFGYQNPKASSYKAIIWLKSIISDMIIFEFTFGEFIKISKIKTGNFILKLYSIYNLGGLK